MSREPALRCYICNRPALPGDAQCRACGFTLDWGAIGDIRSLDYLKLRIEQWRRRGDLADDLAERLSDEAESNRKTLIRVLAEGGAGARPKPAEPPPFRPPVPVARPAARPRGLRPRYTIGPAVADRPAPPPPPPAGEPPPFRPPVPPPPPSPPRRPLLDVLVDFGTVRLMLYTGALLFAVGVMVWLRDALRFQLQRPVVQASLLGLVTFTALAGGVALVVRAKGRTEQRLIGRGVLFLGTLLLPLNPWFWLRTGLIEDRGNAWIVTLVTFVVSLAIALGLGDRIFVYMSYAAALATGWLLTFKLTGGAAPGAYALVLGLVSGAYLHAELPAERVDERRGWEKLGQSFFLCGHIGIALTLLFYTGIARFVPAELFAAFRHFDASGYTPSIGVAVSLLAAHAYLYSAWRRGDVRYTYFGLGAALWSLALSLLAWDVPPGVWLAACGAVAFVALLFGRALESRPLWGPPLRAISFVFAWLGFVSASCVAVAMMTGVEIRWFTALGAALLLLTFAIEASATRRLADAVPLVPLALLLVVYPLRVAGAPWVYADAVLVALLVIAPFAAALLPDDYAETRDGIRYSTIGMCGLFALAGLHFASFATPETAHRPLPLEVALAAAFVASGWTASPSGLRVALHSIAGLFVQIGALLVVALLELHLGVDHRFRTFLLVPLAYAFLAAWLVLRRSTGERTREAGHAARAWASIAAAVAAAYATPLVFDAAFDARGAFLFAFAFALAAAVPLLAAAVERDTTPAYVEGTHGIFLALGAWLGVMVGVMKCAPDSYEAFALVTTGGLGVLVLAAVEVLLARAVPAISRPACVIGGALAMLWLLGLTPVLFDLRSWPAPDRAAFVSLALLLTVAALSGAVRYEHPWRALWTAHAAVAAAAGTHATMQLAPDVTLAALAFVVAGGLVLAAGTWSSRSGSRLMWAAIAIGHAVVAVALVDALRAQPGGQPVPWTFVAVVAAAAVAYTLGAAAAGRASVLDYAHRALALLMAISTAVAALHAAGYTTVAAQAEPLAALLCVAMAIAVFYPSEWWRGEGVLLTHAMMGLLLVVVLGTAFVPAAGWTALKIGQFSLLVALFYAIGAGLKSTASLAASIGAACVSVFAFSVHFGVAWPIRATIFAVLATALLVASTRLPELLAWARSTVETAGHVIFLLALASECALLFPELALGNESLSLHATAFGTLTACAWILRRVLRETGIIYGFAWRGLAIATYVIVGVRLGYHPWRDSAYYTLPVGALLVGLGAWSSRRDDGREASILIWLGSLLAAVPMLLHALDNRFVQSIASDRYDIGTLSVGLALALVGLIFQLRGPAVVGAIALGVDLFVIAFSQITWNQLTLAIFATFVGALMIGVSWFILYRRDDLYRLRDFLGAKYAAFRQWK